MSDRRQLFLRAATTALAATTSGLARDARAGATSPEHSRNGGFGSIVRARFTCTATSSDGTLPTIPLPGAGSVYMVPLTVQQFDESLGARFQMAGDGMVTILQTGLYQLTANWDWPGQHGVDINLRMVFIKRVRVGQLPPAYRPGRVTLLPTTGTRYDNLVVVDTPASDVPVMDRVAQAWSPGTIPVGAAATVDVPLPATRFTYTATDMASASFTSLADASLGAANRGLLLGARVVAPGVARVWLENRYNDVAVTVPAGTLHVTAASAVTTTGNSADAWTYASSPIVMLEAGEKILVAAKSDTAGDYLQISDGSFLQVTAMA